MEEIPSLEKLSVEAQAIHPETELTMAMVAESDPDRLDGAVKDVLEEETERKRGFQSAKASYETAQQEAGISNNEGLQSAAQVFMEAEEKLESFKPKAELAGSVRNLQDRLSWPMRSAATVLSALAIGIGSGLYVAETQPETYGNVAAKQAKSFREIYLKSPVGVGIVFGLMGSVAGSVVAVTFTGREARRRARKIISKQNIRQ